MDFKSCPPGTHLAVCNAVVDLGLQPGSALYPDPKPSVWIRWEIPGERVQYEKDGKKLDGPQVIGNIYTASMHKKARLRLALESWRGKSFTEDEAAAFDVSSILGTSCMLGVVEKISGDKVYSNVGSVLAVPKGVPKMSAENPLLYYDRENREQFDKLPEWIRDKIKKQAKQYASHATGMFAQAESGNYNFTDEQPPASAYADADSTYVDDEEAVPF